MKKKTKIPNLISIIKIRSVNGVKFGHRQDTISDGTTTIYPRIALIYNDNNNNNNSDNITCNPSTVSTFTVNSTTIFVWYII